MSDKPVRHICGLSGGKDSAALAIYLRERVSEMEYVFMDTHKELPETYEYLAKLEAFLGKPIARLNDERGFDHWLKVYNGYLPSSKMRWCTRQLKIRPFEKHVGDDHAISYIGLRADEYRSGYIATKDNIKPVYPFIEDGITKPDVLRILEESGVGLPSYYEWRSRSGCYFCFFQRKIEWVGLLERHPELFNKAKEYEKADIQTGKVYTWQQGECLSDLQKPERQKEIKGRVESELIAKDTTLGSLLEDGDFEISEEPCIVCDL